MRFLVVCLSIHTVPTLCLKDPLIGNETIHPEIHPETIHPNGRVIRWKNVACVLATERQQEHFVNN